MKLTLVISFFLFSFFACHNHKKAANENNVTHNETTNRVSTINETDLIKKGYKKVVVKNYSAKDSNCSFLLETVEDKQILQPIAFLNKYLKEGLVLWVKYRPIRPVAPKCNLGITVNIEDIILGE